MLKLNASYSKKVPADTEYSSQSYHASIECELPDGLSQQQLQERIHSTFELVRQSVEAELHGIPSQQAVTNPAVNQPIPQRVQQPQQQQPQPQAQRRAVHNNVPASSKQINFLLNLANRAGWSVQNLMDHCRVNALEEIDKRECSTLIEKFSGRAA